MSPQATGDDISNGFLTLLKEFENIKEDESPANLIDTTEPTADTLSKSTLLSVELEMLFEIVGSSL
jgi:hypothetical protein